MAAAHGIDSSKHTLQNPLEYTKEQLFMLAVVEIFKNTEIANAYARKAGYPEMKMPALSLSLRGGCAGRAWKYHRDVKGPLVELNEGLFRMNTERFIEITIPHEVAHIAADTMFKMDCAHGQYWRYVMLVVFNIPPERCHDMDVSAGKDCMAAVKSGKK